MNREQLIAAHRERVQRELASEPNDSDPLAGFRRCRKAIRGRPASASAFTVLLARLDRLQLMLNNPGWTLAVLLLLVSTALAHPTVTDTAILGHGDPVPRFAKHYANVLVVPAGTTVTLPLDSTYDAIEVSGTLKASRTHDTVCRTIHLTVLPGGVLDFGTATDPVLRKVEFIFRDVPLRTGTVNAPDIDPLQLGNGLINFGTVWMHGKPLAKTWTTLKAEVLAGATELQLDVPAGWAVGDELLIPDTRQPHYLDPVSGPSTPLRRESKNVIAAIMGDRVTLAKPLDFEHLAARDPDGTIKYLPYVANATRNVVFLSENPAGTRGHIIFLEQAQADCRYLGFLGLGRTQAIPIDNTIINAGTVEHIGTNQIARYGGPHWHHVHGHADSEGLTGRLIGCYLDGLDGSKWGAVQHGTHDLLIADNVANGFIGAGFITEDGYEVRGQYRNNFVMNCRGNGKTGPQNMAEKIPGGEGAGFWLHGMQNAFHGNVAANCAIGFQFFYRDQVLGRLIPSVPGGTADTPLDPRTVVPIAFDDNVAFANQTGIESWNNPVFWHNRTTAWHNSRGWFAGDGQPGNVQAKDLSILQVGGDGIHTSHAYTTSLSLEGGEILGCTTALRTVKGLFSLKNIDIQADVGIYSPGTHSGRDEQQSVLFKAMPGKPLQAIDLGNGFTWKPGDPLPQWYEVAFWRPNTGKNFIVKDWQRQGRDYLLFENYQKRSNHALPAIGYQRNYCPEAGLTNGQCWDKYGIGYYGGVIADAEAIALPGLVHCVAKLGTDYPLGTPRMVLPQPNMLAATPSIENLHFVLTGDAAQGNGVGRVKIDDNPEVQIRRDQFDSDDSLRIYTPHHPASMTPGQHVITTWREDASGQKIAASELTFRYFVGDALPTDPEPPPPVDPTVAELKAKIERLKAIIAEAAAKAALE